MKIHSEKPKLKRVFGLVSRIENLAVPKLVMARSLTPLEDLLNLLHSKTPEDIIYQTFRGIAPQEIRTARAWLVRFGPNVDAPEPLHAGPKALLLDECMPLTILPEIEEMFGKSSHVEAEGWSLSNPSGPAARNRKKVDSWIGAFAQANEFRGLITRDTDFIGIHSRRDHPAGKIHIILAPTNDDNETLLQRIAGNRFKISQALNGDAPPALMRI